MRWRVRFGALVVSVALAWTSLACGLIKQAPIPAREAEARPSRWGTPSVYTRAHRSFGEAVRHFFDIRPAVQQPFPFPHNVHAAQKIGCTDYCHESATKGPVAGIPDVRTCMVCHSAIATERPLIQTLADFEKRGIDLAWQRVYGYPEEAHVRFAHAPHLRAQVDCVTCHGEVARGTVAERTVEMNMAYCVNCHKSKQAPIDCLVCHF